MAAAKSSADTYPTNVMLRFFFNAWYNIYTDSIIFFMKLKDKNVYCLEIIHI